MRSRVAGALRAARQNGRQTAAAMRRARLMMIPAMGHNLLERVWPEVMEPPSRSPVELRWVPPVAGGTLT